MILKTVKQKVSRIGVETLLLDSNGQYYMRIRNRTYTATHPVPQDRVKLWIKELSRRWYDTSTD